MATTKIWPIHQGSSVGVVIKYVENPDKTTEMVFFLETENEDEYAKNDLDTMTDVMEYAMNDRKTAELRLVSGVNINPDNAREEMMITKRHYGKEEGIILWHGYQSFKPGEVTPEEAHRMGVELAESLWDDYEVVVATHIDRNHIHNHFVINSVAFKTGKKLDGKWQDMARESDRICRLHGKSVVENPEFKGKSYGQRNAEKSGGSTWSSAIKTELDEVISTSKNMDEFFRELKSRGYDIKLGKYFTVRPPGKERYVRVERQFGDEYSITGISARIEENVRNGDVKVKGEAAKQTYYCRKPVQRPRHKVKGYMALYYFYCYKLGVFTSRKMSTKQVHYLYRDELRNIDNISNATRLLAKYKIETAGDLKLFEDRLRDELKGLREQRRGLYNRKRGNVTNEELISLDVEIGKLNKVIKAKSRELESVKFVKERSGILQEKIHTVNRLKENEKILEKEG